MTDLKARLLLLIWLAVVALACITTAKPSPPKWWKKDALCVHRYEGAWTSNTGNGYYGGFQMDRTFAKTYGGWIVKHHGLPHNWKPRTQMLVAYRGWLDRGWYPWPNTARYCGLL